MDKTFLKDKIYESMKLYEGKVKSSVIKNGYGGCDVLFSLPGRNERYHGMIVSELPHKTRNFSNGYSYTGSVETTDGSTYDLYCDNDRFDGTYFALKHSESNPRGTRIGKISKGVVVKEDYDSDREEEITIQKYLDDNRLNGEVEVDGSNIYVDIHWGDWKHEHLRCEYLMNKLGYTQEYVEVTEEDGSDCYSAIHTYIKKDMNESLTESLNEEYYPFTFYDEEYNLVPLKTTYNNNGTLAIMVYTDDGEPFGDLTVNLPASDTLADDTHAFVQRDFWVKDFIKQTKIGRPMGEFAKSGFSTFELYEFDIDKLDDM